MDGRLDSRADGVRAERSAPFLCVHDIESRIEIGARLDRIRYDSLARETYGTTVPTAVGLASPFVRLSRTSEDKSESALQDSPPVFHLRKSAFICG